MRPISEERRVSMMLSNDAALLESYSFESSEVAKWYVTP